MNNQMPATGRKSPDGQDAMEVETPKLTARQQQILDLIQSAIARTGGLVATALLGGVLGAKGDALMTGFHAAIIACAIACALASAAAFFLIPAGERK